MVLIWIKGIIRNRWGRLLGSIVGIAVTIALFASIETFISYSSASMTKQAVSGVPVDWQIQLTSGANEQDIRAKLSEAAKVTDIQNVGYADTSGFEVTSAGGTVQTTGPGKVLGISPDYASQFPGEIRALIGSTQGVLVAQQTAANLHVQIGDSVSIQRVGLSPVSVKVDGIIDLPNADSLFQAIGLPAGAAPQAPPDNVLLIPIDKWHQLFDEQAAVRPDSVHMQLHTKLDDSGLPSDPNAAYTVISQNANNLEARIAGSGTIGNNIGARLGAAREDALYANVLFLFLGLPGLVLAVLLTLFIAASGARHRAQEQGVLRVHGASARQILRLQSLESLLTGVGGVFLGIVFTLATVALAVPGDISVDSTKWIWIGISSVSGLAIAFAATMYPAWRLLKNPMVESSKTVGVRKKPFWQRFYLDIILIAIAGVEFWRTASTGYQVVLAPEGVTAISVNYEAFIAPFFLWIGGVFLAMRLYSFSFDKGKKCIARIIRPITKGLSSAAVSSMSRERTFLLKGVVFIALAVSFAVSTAIFNTTYNAQAAVDAQLTNGADVTITGITPFSPGDSRIKEIQSLSGVAGMQTMQHRFAYVGSDLQDIYGIDAAHISDATSISNAFFGNGNAQSTLAALAQREDAVLVSEETVKDFQLQPGDKLNLRLQDAKDHQYHVIPFHYVGVVREFPTAPTDSFLVANASYIAKMTHNPSSEAVLLKASGNPEDLANQVVKALGTRDVRITDIGSTQRVINSSLTSVNMHGLTTLELVFAILLIGSAMGLVLALGLADRRRNFAILQALGAKNKQRNAFIWSEALMMLSGGIIIGIILGFGIAAMLVTVLTGVFDPPPDALSVPWGYIAAIVCAAGVAAFLGGQAIKRACRHPLVEMLRNI